MKLSKYYDHYFNNGGLCPSCNHVMTFHFGCTNIYCPECQKHAEEDSLFCKRVIGADKKKVREKDRYFKYLIRKKHARKNIDKCEEKKYADIEHS
jgi:predicted amidophosphoribosyltransferase